MNPVVRGARMDLGACESRFISVTVDGGRDGAFKEQRLQAKLGGTAEMLRPLRDGAFDLKGGARTV